MVLCNIGPKRNHQLIGFTSKDKQVNLSHEVRMKVMYFVITTQFGVVAAAIKAKVDCVD
jgi:hypothetical protein